MTSRDKNVREQVLNMCWEYLRDNFHKFSEANKLKAALSLSSRTIPQEVQGVSQQIIVMNEIKKEDQPLRFHIGSDVA